MRIAGPNATARLDSASGPRRAASGGFSVSEGETTKSTAAIAPLRTIGGIDLARAARREARASGRGGRSSVYMLRGLNLEVLAGTAGPAALTRFKAAAPGLRDGSGDPGLYAVPAEIELRVEVKIA